MNRDVFQAVDDFFALVNMTPSTEAGDKLVRLAATYPVDVAIEALARLYVVAATRERFHKAKEGIGMKNVPPLPTEAAKRPPERDREDPDLRLGFEPGL